MTSFGLVMDAPLDGLKGADYNPRKIDEAGISRLQESIRSLGMVKPIIARGEIIVAGHQRTKALREMGVETAPVYFLSRDTTTYDEVRFNQLHNGTDLDAGDEDARITCDLSDKEGFVTVGPEFIEANQRGKLAPVRLEIMKLLSKFGPWGAVVATQSGNIVHCAQYAISCMILGEELLCYVVPDGKAAKYSDLLSDEYGTFSYDGLARSSYVQTFAQPARFSEKNDWRSTLYEQAAIPWMNKNKGARLLDFGCGRGDYVKKLYREGYNIMGLEFWRRAPGKSKIDTRAGHRMITAVIESLREHGPYDAVLADFVLNSVDSKQAQWDVVETISALVKEGGKVFFSGRQRERITELARRDTFASNNSERGVYFLDEDGLSALFRKGEWFYQMFHSRSDIMGIANRMNWKDLHYSTKGITWRCAATQGKRNVTREGISREFDLEHGPGKRYNRSQEILDVMTWLD